MGLTKTGIGVSCFAMIIAACGAEINSEEGRIGTAEQRADLFEYIMEKTRIREAWSPIKNELLNFDPLVEMEALRGDVVNAKSDEDLYYALVRLSNARNDRHLSVKTVEGGLQVPGLTKGSLSGYPDKDAGVMMAVPVKFQTDFGQSSYGLFVGDTGKSVGAEGPQTGDKIISINGAPVADYVDRIKPYHRFSSVPGLWLKMAGTLHTRTPVLPASFYEKDMTLWIESSDGVRREVTLDYVPSDQIMWQGIGAQKGYEGFEKVSSSQTLDIFKPTDDRKVIIIQWHWFSASLIEDVDAVMAWASEEGVLDYDLIFDATVARGGGRGAYAISRFTSKAFKTTFGNLKISDITPDFIAKKRKQYDNRNLSDGAPENAGDDGTWLINWLEDDVMKAFEAGNEYSNNVPFKLAHAPKWSDGVIKPAKTHFTGKMVCLFGPYGGSHLDQFAAIVNDNDICHSIGMPTGGYSNTWEWDEVLKMPGSDKPVVSFMWDIGHTIGPKGQIVEGNAAPVDDFIPVTSENFSNYNQIIFDRALQRLNDK